MSHKEAIKDILSMMKDGEQPFRIEEKIKKLVKDAQVEGYECGILDLSVRLFIQVDSETKKMVAKYRDQLLVSIGKKPLGE